MLNTQILELGNEQVVILDPNGDTHTIRPGKIICDPKYWVGSVVTKEIIRCIMILKKDKLGSRNVIFLKKHLKRQNDVFCVVLGQHECACPEEFEIAILSTVKETDQKPEEEIRPVLNNFTILRSFIEVRKVYSNTDQGNVYFTRNVDESAILDNIYDDIVDICGRLNIKHLKN